jgi:hypothetical protein
VTVSPANRRDVRLPFRWALAALVAALLAGAVIGALIAASNADSNRALASQRQDRIRQLRNERDDLLAEPPITTTTPPSETSTTPTTAPPEADPAPAGPAVARVELAVLTLRVSVTTRSYDRRRFGGWIDADHDCQDTRAEVLIAESLTPTTGGCTVVIGAWDDPYTGARVLVAHQLDIDHLVPLSNAWSSGASTWPPLRRVAYANYLDDPVHLIAVSASANRSKGDRSPDQWRPPNTHYWCTYAADWVEVKTRWQLTVTNPERVALASMLESCAP